MALSEREELELLELENENALAAGGGLQDAPNSSQPLSGQKDMLKELTMALAKIYGIATTPAVELPAFARGVGRNAEPESSGIQEQVSNVAGRSAIPIAAAALTGGALGPATAGLSAGRAALATAGAETLAGGAGEIAGQAVARGAGNKEAISPSEVGAQAAISGVLGGATRLAAEGARAGIPAAKGASRSVIDLAAKYGVNLTPAEIKASKALSGLEAFLEKTFLGSDYITARREESAEALRKAKDNLLAKAGTEKERQAVGLAFFEKIRQRSAKFNDAVRETYRRAFSRAPEGETIQVDNFMEASEALAAKANRSPFGGGGSGATGQRVVEFFDDQIVYHVPGEGEIAEAIGRSSKVPATPGSGDFRRTYPSLAGETEQVIPREGYDIFTPPAGNRTIGQADPYAGLGAEPLGADRGLEGIPQVTEPRTVKISARVDPYTGAKKPVAVSPEDLITIRNDVNQAIADYDQGLKLGIKTMSSTQAGAYKQILKAIEMDMDTYAASGRGGKDFVDSYRRAKGLAKTNYSIFNSPAVVGVLKRNPEAIEGIIGRDSISDIQALKKAAGPRGFDEIRGLWLKQLLSDPKTEAGKSLANALTKYSDDTLGELFKDSPKALNELREIASLQSLVGSAERSTPMVGSARTVANTMTASAGATVGALLGGPAGAAAGVAGTVLLPAQIAKIYLSPQGRKVALEGLRAGPGTRAWSIAAARLVGIAGKNATGD